MKIDLSPIIYDKINQIIIDDIVTLDDEIFKNTSIRSLSDIKIIGQVIFDNDEFVLKLNLAGEMTLPCTVSLEDVIYPFSIEIDETFIENDENNEEYLKTIDNTIDIMPIIWQNIVVEIPTRIVSPNLEYTNLKGNGWELLTDEDKKSKMDPRFDKLRDLLDD